MQVIGVHLDGGMRERILLPASHLYRCDKLNNVEMALVETLGVGAHAVGRSSVEKGERVLVAGTGPIGLSVIEFLKVEGADIGVIERNPKRLDFCRNNYKLTRCYASHEEAKKDDPPTLVFDCTGDKPSMDNAVQLVRHGGRLVFVGLINDSFSIFDPEFHRRETTLLASRNANPHEHRRTIELMESGVIDIKPWPADIIEPAAISERFPNWIDKYTGTVKGIVNFA
jgi:2-desacetyl-2-hydroxyethyl bacteriochlorophyllide A dehydrogenase